MQNEEHEKAVIEKLGPILDKVLFQGGALSGKPLNGWNEWSRHVLGSIERMEENIKGLHKEVSELRIILANIGSEKISKDVADLIKDKLDLNVKLAKLETAFNIKSGIWGLIGAAIPTVGFILFELVKKKASTP
jgi:hypothetical protein